MNRNDKLNNLALKRIKIFGILYWIEYLQNIYSTTKCQGTIQSQFYFESEWLVLLCNNESKKKNQRNIKDKTWEIAQRRLHQLGIFSQIQGLPIFLYVSFLLYVMSFFPKNNVVISFFLSLSFFLYLSFFLFLCWLKCMAASLNFCLDQNHCLECRALLSACLLNCPCSKFYKKKNHHKK